MPDFKIDGQLNESIPNNTPVVHTLCPGCNAQSNFIPVLGIDDLIVRRSGSDNQLYGMRMCPNASCKTLIWFHRPTFSNNDDLFVYPPAGAILTVAFVPPAIADDAKEALLCFQVHAWKATAIMCRRVIEGTCEEKGATGSNLKEEIDDLFAKGHITDQLKQWAHQLRHFGNFGAHLTSFGSITDSDAAAMIDFMFSFLRYVYEMPAKIAAAQARSGRS